MNNVNFKDNHDKLFETCIICININHSVTSKLFIISVYRTPNSDFGDFLDKLYNLMFKFYNNDDKYIVCGDFNVNMFLDSKTRRDLENLFNEFGMRNLIDQATRNTDKSNTCIDLMFSDIICDNIVIENTHISDHTFQICCFNIIVSDGRDTGDVYLRDYSESNLIAFKNLLNNENWIEVYNALDVNSMFDNFSRLFRFHYDCVFTFKKLRQPKRKKKWYTNELRELHVMMCQMANIVKNTSSNIIKSRFKTLKESYQKKLQETKNYYYYLGRGWLWLSPLATER